MGRTLAGTSRLHEEMRNAARSAITVPIAHEMGTITAAYGLAVDQFQDDSTGQTARIEIPMGQYLVLRSCTLPLDFAARTPDGVNSYTTHPSQEPSDPDVLATPPDEEGAHDHVAVGPHTHSWSGGDPQGGSVGGTTGSSTVTINATDLSSPTTSAPYEGHHHHHVLTPPQLRPLQPGDRVLVAWVYGSAQPIVIDVVVNSMLIPTAPSGGL